jgi:hypothetical protein
MEQPVDVARMVHEYLGRFHKNYQLPRHFQQEEELLAWCRQLGPEYKNWSLYKGHYKDPYCVLHILDAKWCTLFELQWAHLIQGHVDIN